MTQNGLQQASPAPREQSRAALILRFALGLLALLGLVVLLVRTLRPELESVGTWFVARFGLVGVAVGTFIADGFHFPLPPQFYMLLATAARSDPLSILVATSVGSLAGGTAGYFVARRLGHVGWMRRWLERLTGNARELVGQRYPYRSAAIASATPVAFSVLCYLAGLFRLGRGPLLLVLVLRVPKLVLYYYFVRVGWNL